MAAVRARCMISTAFCQLGLSFHDCSVSKGSNANPMPKEAAACS